MGTKTDILRELAGEDPKKLRIILDRITAAVAETFKEDRTRSGIVLLSQISPSQAEVKRRTNLAYDWFIRLRADCHYSTRKALDYLPRAIRAELDGESWEPPPAETSWGFGS